MPRTTRGFTIVELVVVMLMLGVVATIALPRAIKSSPELQVDLAAKALTRDLEQMRMQAIAAKRSVRVVFDESENFYTAYMDISPMRAASFALSSEEVKRTGLLTRGSSGGVPGVPLPKRVEFGIGLVSVGPQGYGASDAIGLDNDWVEFDTRGMVNPAGSDGVVFLVHTDDPSAIAAVTISGASAFQAWRYRGGEWIK